MTRNASGPDGRFLQTDPVPEGNANSYDYCNADPINCYDLEGLVPIGAGPPELSWEEKEAIRKHDAFQSGLGGSQPMLLYSSALRGISSLEGSVRMTWYSVLQVLAKPPTAVYEERITLWKVVDFDQSVDLAGMQVSAMTGKHRGMLDSGYASSYQTDISSDGPSGGDELYSLVRDSDLRPHEYYREHYGDDVRNVDHGLRHPYHRNQGVSSASSWFSVRCVFSWSSRTTYEDRVTVWRCGTADTAIKEALDEGRNYAKDILDGELLGVQSVHRIDHDMPGHGTLVFAHSRRSNLSLDSYIKRYYDTGREKASDS